MKLFSRKTTNQFAPRTITLSDSRHHRSMKWVWIVVGILLIVLLVVGWQLLQTRMFRVEVVKVVQLVQSKPHVVPNDQLQKLASGIRGESLLLMNEQEIAEDWLHRMPALEKMFIKKIYPNQLVIEYVPRVAFSQLVAPSSGYLVDREGYIFAKHTPVDYLPKVFTDQNNVKVGESTSAKGLRLAQNLIVGLRNTNPRLVSILFHESWLELTMTGDPRIFISGDKAALPTLKEISVLFNKFATDEKYPKEIDMRYDRPVLRY